LDGLLHQRVPVDALVKALVNVDTRVVAIANEWTGEVTAPMIANAMAAHSETLVLWNRALANADRELDHDAFAI
jgi:hypothetical protein